MPIKGLSERRRLPRLGRIRIGEQVESKKKKGVFYPHATDHFVVPPEVAQVYGDKATVLDIMLPVENEEVFASQFYRAYSRTRGLVCKGDGVEASRLIDIATKTGEPKTGVVTGEIAKHDVPGAVPIKVELIDVICPGRDCPYYQAKQCREIMNFQFLLPDVPGLGVWQIDTSSYNSILNINSALALVRASFGMVTGIPLLLSVEPAEATPEGKKKTIYVLNLRTKVTLRELGKARGKLIAISPHLPQSDDEIPESLFLTPEQEEAQAADEEEEVQAQTQKDIDALYGPPATIQEPHIEVPIKDAGPTPIQVFHEGSEIRAKVETPIVAKAVEASESQKRGTPPLSKEVKTPIPIRVNPSITAPTTLWDQEGEPPAIDLDWLKASLQKLQWVNVPKWLKDHYGVPIGASVQAMVLKLNTEQQKDFEREVKGRLLEIIDQPHLIGKE